MTFRDAVANEMREAGRGAAANLEGRAGEYRRTDTTVTHHRDVAEARQQAAEAQQEHHQAAHADHEAQHEAQAAEAEAQQPEQAHEPTQEPENDGPEYGD
jgi:hypothetical protein